MEAKAKFPLGQLIATRGVSELMDENAVVYAGVMRSIARHLSGDWGDLDLIDATANDEALKWGNRILSSYLLPTTSQEDPNEAVRIWIITEADRSSTTVLFPGEY